MGLRSCQLSAELNLRVNFANRKYPINVISVARIRAKRIFNVLGLYQFVLDSRIFFLFPSLFFLRKIGWGQDRGVLKCLQLSAAPPNFCTQNSHYGAMKWAQIFREKQVFLCVCRDSSWLHIFTKMFIGRFMIKWGKMQFGKLQIDFRTWSISRLCCPKHC